MAAAKSPQHRERARSGLGGSGIAGKDAWRSAFINWIDPMATTTTFIDRAPHNIIDQLAKLGDNFFAGNTSSSPLLLDATAPLLLVAPRSDYATSSVAVSLPYNGLATKLMDNAARLSNSEHARSKEDLDIRNMTNRWKTMFDDSSLAPTILHQ
ncbi:unnamed protein product [Miscanthus lutarioriparius]|uniref:Uncharacterized protein n=1 Tax=Miscanthus lutarioriparius TaxID=422564 RepID=A0A811QBG3_9POAL|nr:unnamed protein product [Miscanthus lutarioriparius]